jgi:predicted ABC-type ATPase
MRKRLRVFAGPNGSGKSSIIKRIRDTKVENDRTLDFGNYINADDIASDLRQCFFDISKFDIKFSLSDFFDVANSSGLLNDAFKLQRVKECITFDKGKIAINIDFASKTDDYPYERIAQSIADYLRKKLLDTGAKFSFETVFSHSSKIDIIKQAKDKGYRVYLYFVSTEDPEINIYRVKVVRLGKNGHDVPEDRIKDRYYRSMNLMYDAAQYCYRAYFFDNSTNGGKHSMFASFNLNKFGKKIWDIVDRSAVPGWFIKYYSKKVKG